MFENRNSYNKFFSTVDQSNTLSESVKKLLVSYDQSGSHHIVETVVVGADPLTSLLFLVGGCPRAS